MKLVIGGYAQGKLQYVLNSQKQDGYLLYDAQIPEENQYSQEDTKHKTVIIHHLHLWIKQQLAMGRNPEEQLFAFLNQHKDCILICDEIGNGIVPMEETDRNYRETTGRILIKLAKQADEVVRVLCGIGQRIK